MASGPPPQSIRPFPFLKRSLNAVTVLPANALNQRLLERRGDAVKSRLKP
jgi:hypothetical protein